MISITKRAFTTDIGQVFIDQNVQKLLKDITRFEDKKVFAKRIVPALKSSKFMFMTDKQLEKAKEDAYEQVKARLQMPPVLTPDTKEPEILSRDEAIVGYTKFKIMFVDIGSGYTNRTRLMSVREPDGTLRYPTHEERSRLNHIFYPHDAKSIDTPKLFEEKNLTKLLKRKEYLYILNRACFQFEPDDPIYFEVTSRVYNHIEKKGDFAKLRSTRHFGPMSLFLAHSKNADNLILEMLSKNLIEDAYKLVKIYNTCHNIDFVSDDHIAVLRHYSDNSSSKKYNLDLALQSIEAKKATNTETMQDANSEQTTE